MKQRTEQWILWGMTGLVALGCLVWILLQHTSRTPGRSAQVRVSGEVRLELPLSENRREVIHGANGIDLTVVVENGGVFVEKSACLDKICVRKGKISAAGETIVCLPARTIVEIKEPAS